MSQKSYFYHPRHDNGSVKEDPTYYQTPFQPRVSFETISRVSPAVQQTPYHQVYLPHAYHQCIVCPQGVYIPNLICCQFCKNGRPSCFCFSHPNSNFEELETRRASFNLNLPRHSNTYQNINGSIFSLGENQQPYIVAQLQTNNPSQFSQTNNCTDHSKNLVTTNPTNVQNGERQINPNIPNTPSYNPNAKKSNPRRHYLTSFQVLNYLKNDTPMNKNNNRDIPNMSNEPIIESSFPEIINQKPWDRPLSNQDIENGDSKFVENKELFSTKVLKKNQGDLVDSINRPIYPKNEKVIRKTDHFKKLIFGENLNRKTAKTTEQIKKLCLTDYHYKQELKLKWTLSSKYIRRCVERLSDTWNKQAKSRTLFLIKKSNYRRKNFAPLLSMNIRDYSKKKLIVLEKS